MAITVPITPRIAIGGPQAVALTLANDTSFKPNEVGYAIYRNGVQIAITSKITYHDTGLQDGSTYTYNTATVGSGALQSALSPTATITLPKVLVSNLQLVNLILEGNGSPIGAFDAAVGTLYVRLDGGTTTTFYVKETAGSSGWVAK